jgi:hypothetical protein
MLREIHEVTGVSLDVSELHSPLQTCAQDTVCVSNERRGVTRLKHVGIEPLDHRWSKLAEASPTDCRNDVDAEQVRVMF